MANKRLIGLWLATAIGVGAGVLAGHIANRWRAVPYPESVEEGFVSLFNGRDLTGWEGEREMYGVLAEEPGVLQCFPNRERKHGGNLVTAQSYRNFVLRFEYCMPRNGNNGLGLRIPEGKTGEDAAYQAMGEIQLLDDGGEQYTAEGKHKLKPYQYTGSLYGVFPSRMDNVGKQVGDKEKNFAGGGSYARRAGMWNFMEVRVAGSAFETWLNGYLICKGDVAQFKGTGDTLDKRQHPGLHTERGRIGFLGHGHNVKWRNIRIKSFPDTATLADLVPPATPAPKGFEPCFVGNAGDLQAHWKGVTQEEGFDNPVKRQQATAEKRAQMQERADAAMAEHWSVIDGVLHFDGFKGGYNLATKRIYGDFELWADWRLLSITGDSGIYLRGTPQVQIWDAHNQWHIGSGGLYNNKQNPRHATEIADKPIGDWNRFYVKMVGERVTVRLNGKTVVDNVVMENYWNGRDAVFPSEQIELQCHGDPIEWRNIYIRAL